ncbi:HEPN domain-containing protein [Sphingobium cupriresistens]|uniref:HEPN domain-containing protein n=1 Tax=Sphingobium cupriresistens TaxID=1132417 RepID=A0A8G2DYY0_9SPHN|nr:HEPN domain-containing protein [Sphingobium cupriresistens]RYM13129.1 HEPN domain-containing protein [Sphingobium cupriresistens]
MHIRINAHVLSDVASRFCDEAKSTQFFAFANSNSAYHFNEESPFGNEVGDCFPDALFDIEEAAKCFSLSRYTACVYHVMRAAENAVAVLAERLGATYQSKNGETLSWGKLTSNIKAKIDEMERGTDQDDLLRAYMLLHSCNRAYRTKTAHPGIKYTQEEADTVLRSTKSFMSEMAGLVSNWCPPPDSAAPPPPPAAVDGVVDHKRHIGNNRPSHRGFAPLMSRPLSLPVTRISDRS